MYVVLWAVFSNQGCAEPAPGYMSIHHLWLFFFSAFSFSLPLFLFVFCHQWRLLSKLLPIRCILLHNISIVIVTAAQSHHTVLWTSKQRNCEVKKCVEYSGILKPHGLAHSTRLKMGNIIFEQWCTWRVIQTSSISQESVW